MIIPSMHSTAPRAEDAALLYARFLVEYGVPAVLARAGGRTPALIVLTSSGAHPMLTPLHTSFGGVLAQTGTPGAMLDARESGLWVAAGEGAARAVTLVARHLDRIAAALHPSAALAWRALQQGVEVAATVMSPDSDRTPRAADRALRHTAATLERLLAPQLPAYPALVTSVTQLVDGAVQDDLFVGSMRVPVRAQLDMVPTFAPIPAPTAPITAGELREIPPMPAAELEAAVRAYAGIEALAEDSKAARLAEHLGATALGRTFPVRGIPIDDVLLFHWCATAWADVPAEVRTSWFARTHTALQSVRRLQETGAMPGRTLTLPDVDSAVLSALAAARLTGTLTAPGTDASLPGIPVLSYDGADVMARLAALDS